MQSSVFVLMCAVFSSVFAVSMLFRVGRMVLGRDHLRRGLGKIPSLSWLIRPLTQHGNRRGLVEADTACASDMGAASQQLHENSIGAREMCSAPDELRTGPTRHWR